MKFWRKLILLTALLGCFWVITASANAASQEDLIYEISDEKVTITGCDISATGDLVIPDIIEGYPVTAIGDYAFRGCTELTSVIVGNNVTHIGYAAFYECGALTNVTMANSVVSIDQWAFGCCGSLVDIVLPNDLTVIEYCTFYECESLTNITMGDHIKVIGEWAFAECSSLKYVNISDSVTTLGDYAFCNCESLKFVAVGNGVTTIGVGAFGYCSSLKTVTFRGSAPQMGEDCFLYVTARLYYPAGDDSWTDDMLQSYGGNPNWTDRSATTPVCQIMPGEVAQYSDFGQAVAAYDPKSQYIQLIDDTQIHLSLDKELIIDLNGFDLTGILDSNDHRPCGVDTATDDYTDENAGIFDCVDTNGKNVVPTVHIKTEEDVFGAVKRYVAIKEWEGYTFHRFYLGITHATYHVPSGGIGCKAAFAGDSTVKSALGERGLYGIQISISEEFEYGVETYFPANEFPAQGKAQSRSLLIMNIIGADIPLGEMIANAEMSIYARAVIAFPNGTVIYSNPCRSSLKELVQEADRNFENLTAVQQLHLRNLCIQYANLVKDWGLKNV